MHGATVVERPNLVPPRCRVTFLLFGGWLHNMMPISTGRSVKMKARRGVSCVRSSTRSYSWKRKNDNYSSRSCMHARFFFFLSCTHASRSCTHEHSLYDQLITTPALYTYPSLSCGWVRFPGSLPQPYMLCAWLCGEWLGFILHSLY